jgi:hypothetical protein
VECCRREDQLRELFEEPDLTMAAEDAEDPALRQRIADVVSVASNDEAIATQTTAQAEREALLATRTDEVAQTDTERAALVAAHPAVTVPATATERAAALATETTQTNALRVRDRDASADVEDEHAEEAEMAEGISTARELQARFAQLKADHGTIGALQLLLEGEDALQNPEMRAIVQRTIGTARSLVTALPGREDVVTRLLDQSGLNLGAANNVAAFADFLTAVNASDDLSDDEKATLRQVLNTGDEIETGGDANEVFRQGALETYIDENGVEQTRRVPLQPGDRVPFGHGHELGIDGNGQRKAWIHTAIGTYESNLPENPTDQDMGSIIRTVQLRATLHELNVAHIFYPDVHDLEYGGGTVEVYPSHYPITDRFLSTVVQERALAGNSLLSDADLQQIPYLLQFQNRRGDLGIEDVNPEQTREDYQAQGILDAHGVLNWDRFAAMVEANRMALYTGERNYALQAQRAA